MLNDARHRVEREVADAKGNGKVVHDDVLNWLGRVHEVSSDEKAAELERALDRARARCFLGLCPNLCSRWQLCKKAIAEAKDVAVLHEYYIDANMFEDRVAYRPKLTEVMLDEYIMTFESRDTTFEGIMMALKEQGVSTIGVYGMGGVGKSTLIKQVQQKAREEKIFEEIASTTVTSQCCKNRTGDRTAQSKGSRFNRFNRLNRRFIQHKGNKELQQPQFSQI